ncbi:hypothetical protein ONZ45_g9987 [Pleurotus djamor]|nr:hypothetical protein ONZ45_g9987 [Pleurotus djamor]
MITFTPLSGAARASSVTPLCYLLQIDDVRILLDCGSPDWCPEPNESTLSPGEYPWESYCNSLREICPTIDLVLISHGDLAHSGLYPYAYSRWNLTAPAYTTLPVQAMAKIAASEDVEGIRDEEDVGDAIQESTEDNLDDPQEDVNAIPRPKDNVKGKYVATLHEVRYRIASFRKCQGLTITPFNAGHTLGGTIWKIRSPSSGTIMYAVNMNHMKERHLDGTVLMRGSAGGIFEPLARPDLLITDAERANVITSRKKDRDLALIDTITATLSSRSSLLLPCDSSSEMLTFVRSMMEWLGGTLSKEDVGEENPGQRQNKRKKADDGTDEALGALALRFKHLEFFPNPLSLLERYSSKDPKLILAVPASLSHGSARHLFSQFATIPDNVVLLTQRGEEGTLGRMLFDKWNNSQRGDDRWDKGRIGSNIMMDGVIKMKINTKVPLQGAELDAYLQEQREAKEKAAAQQAVMARNRRMLEADEDESDSESDDSDAEDEDEVRQALEGDAMDIGDDSTARANGRRRQKTEKAENDWNMDGDEGLTKQLLSYDIYLKGNVSKSTSFFKSVGGQSQRFRMFPFVEKKRRVDEYGETIDVAMWLRKGKILEEEAESEEAKAKRREVDEEAKAIEEPPSKFVSTDIEIQPACRLLFIDMEGLNDGRAVKHVVPKINPRKMIIVHASPSATDALLESCADIRAMTKDIFAPSTGESIQIGQQTNTFSISISDELLASIKMSRFEDNEIGYVTGRVMAHATSTLPTLEPEGATNTSTRSSIQSLRGRMLGSRAPVTIPHSTMIGELKLTALKAKLATVGVQAELIGEGVLICGAAAKRGASTDVLGESVAVRKTGRGKVELEGNVSDVYYIVRKEIYNLHALVAA